MVNMAMNTKDNGKIWISPLETCWETTLFGKEDWELNFYPFLSFLPKLHEQEIIWNNIMTFIWVITTFRNEIYSSSLCSNEVANDFRQEFSE